MYTPLSPARALTTYCPESPKRVNGYRPRSPVYQPQSPRQYEESFLDIINRKRNVKPKFSGYKFVPVYNWKVYLKWMKQSNATKEKLEEIEYEHTSRNIPEVPPEKIIYKRKICDTPIDWVYTDVKVVNGKVKLTIEPPPVLLLHEKYYSKGINPPLGVYLKQMKKFGYTDSELQKIMERREAWNLDDENAFLEKVFGKKKK